MFGRSRWAALGAVVAVLLGGGGLLTASAAGSSNASSFVPITPCRLMDTRSGSTVGPRSSPFGAAEVYEALVWGTNGACTIPDTATAVGMNVTFVNPTAAGFLTVFPAGDAPDPLTSNLNWVAGQPPAPNAVTTPLSANGRVGLYNNAGTVDVIVDIVGYYELSSSGPAGPAGPSGPAGPAGPAGVQGIQGPSGLQAVGQFTPTQIIEGAVVTCTSVSNGANFTTCNGPLVNGLELSLTSFSDSTHKLCDTIQFPGGLGFIGTGFGGVSAATKFGWNGTTWVLETASTQVVTQVTCQ